MYEIKAKLDSGYKPIYHAKHYDESCFCLYFYDEDEKDRPLVEIEISEVISIKEV